MLYSVKPFVKTGTLEDLLKHVGGKMTALQALQIMQQLCNAVQYAHEHDVIHGNIKPTNIFVAADSRMLLSDFGIVRGYDDSQQSMTRIGWGSAEYAAPEQSLGVLRRASDIYSLGVLLFRILTGEPPFTGHTPVEVLLKHVRQQAPSARSLDPNISEAVDGVLHRALQKRSDERFASIEEFSNALTVAISVAPIAFHIAEAVTPITSQRDDPDITLARETYALKDTVDTGSHTSWSTEPLEWSPIGEETGNAIPATASEYLGSLPTPPGNVANEPSSQLKPGTDKETRSAKKDLHSRLNQLLPMLVVILLLIGLIVALLSSFFLPASPSSGNTGKDHLVVVVRTMPANS